MKMHLHKNILLVIIFFAAKTISAQTPVVFALDRDVLKNTKSRIASKDDGLMPAYKQLAKDAEKALKEEPHSVMEKKQVPPSGDKHDYMSLAPYFWPDPSKPDGLPYMRKDGQTNPEVKDFLDKEYMPAMCEQVQTLALAYYLSDDERFAGHAAQLLKVWFLDPATKMNPNLNYAQAIKGSNEGRGAGLIDVRHFIKLIDAIGLLKDSKSWSKEDQQGMKQWFAEFLKWMETSTNGISEMNAQNNHGTWYDALRLSIAMFIENKDEAKKIIDNVKKRLDQQMDNEGKFPKEMERTIALHYNLFDLEAFFLVASMADKIGINLWDYTSPSGKSLKKGFDFLYPYLTKEKEWTGQQIKEFDFDEGYPVLLMASKKLNCTNCRQNVVTLASDKAPRLRQNLLY